MKEKLIKIDGILYYANHFCEYCGKNIRYHYWHKYRRIPTYCWGHNPNPDGKFKKGQHASIETEWKKGYHPPTEWKKGNKPLAPFKKGKKHLYYGKYGKEHPAYGNIPWNYGLIAKDDKRIVYGKNHPNYGKFGKEHPRYIDGYGNERCRSKKRGLGFIPMNEKTKLNNTMHHIGERLVIFIPRRIHESFKHSIKTDYRLKEMNRLAYKVLFGFDVGKL